MQTPQLRAPKAGPFKGVEIPPDEVSSRNRIDQSIYEIWDARRRTPHVLEVFAPAQGWAVTIDQRELPHRFNKAVDGVDVAFPATLFLASLVRDDKVLAQASHCEIITCPQAYAWGENGARNRLYEAIGLAGGIDYEDAETSPKVLSTAQVLVAGTAGTEAKDPLQGVSAISVDQARALEGTDGAKGASSGRAARGKRSVPPVVAAVAALPAASSAAPEPSPASAGDDQQEASNDDPVKPATLRQAELWAERKKIVLPKFLTQSQAATFVKDAMRGVL